MTDPTPGTPNSSPPSGTPADTNEIETDFEVFEKLAACAKVGILDRIASGDWDLVARLVWSLNRRREASGGSRPLVRFSRSGKCAAKAARARGRQKVLKATARRSGRRWCCIRKRAAASRPRQATGILHSILR